MGRELIPVALFAAGGFMAIERVDVNIPSGLPADVAAAVSQSHIDAQEKASTAEKDSSELKRAEQKIAIKRAAIQESGLHREEFRRNDDMQQKLQFVMAGGSGPDAANALSSWNNNNQLQSKLTEAQKNQFRETMTQNPPRATAAGNALNRLSQQPGFGRAVTTAPLMGTLQAGLLENAALERPAGELIESRFMQSPKADAQTKGQFMRFGLQQAAKSQLESIKRAGDMLGTLAQTNVPRGAQRAAMSMVQRVPGDATATSNLDSFAQHPEVRALPTFARGKATELLAKANGKSLVKDGFQQLATDPKFKVQTAQNKGRFFSTVGSGKPSEFRAITDQALVALRSSDFPNRASQVGRFLTKMSAKVQQGGASAVDVKTLVKDAKKSPLPTPPRLVSTEGLSDEDAAHVRSQNRGQVLHYFNQMQRLYETGEKQLRNAKYLEDVNSLKTLRDPPEVDTSALSAEELAIYNERRQSVSTKRTQVLKLQQQRSRELRNKRMPPAKRRAMMAERRTVGRQPRYYQPGRRTLSTNGALTQAATGTDGAPPPPRSSLMGRPMRSGATVVGRGAPAPTGDTGILGDTAAHVSAAVAQFGDGPITPERVTQVAHAIARQVAQQVAQQVTAQLLSGGTTETSGLAFSAPPPAPSAAPSGPPSTGTPDGWGIPRVFDRDLGGTQRAVVRPALTASDDANGPNGPPSVEPKYTGKALIKDDTAVRGLDTLLESESGWNELSRGEQVLLRNLGWNGQLWAARNSPTANWPIEMATAYMNLSPAKREAVRKLGSSAAQWDSRIQALTMGKNA